MAGRGIALVLAGLLLGGCVHTQLEPASEANFTQRDKKLLANAPYAKANIPAAYQRAIQLDRRLAVHGTRGAARAFARMGDDRQAIRWLELALDAGDRGRDALLSDPDFDRYRGAIQLRGIRARDASSRRASEGRDASA